MRVFTEVGVTLKGDEAAARRNIPLARTLLGIMKSVNAKTNEVQRWRRTLPDGTRVDLASFHGRDYIQIESPTDSREDLFEGISYQTIEDAYRIVVPPLFTTIQNYDQNKRAVYVRKDSPSWDEQASSYLSGGNIDLPVGRLIVGVIPIDADGVEHIFAVYKEETVFHLEYYRRSPPSLSLVLTSTYSINQDQEFTFEVEGNSPETATKFSVASSEILPAFTYNLLGTEAYCILVCKPSNPAEGCGVITVVLKLSIATGAMVVEEHLKGGHLVVVEHSFVGTGETGVNVFANPELKNLPSETGTYNGGLTRGIITSRLTTQVSGSMYVDLGISEEGVLLLTELSVEGGEQNDWQFSGDNPSYTVTADSRPPLQGYTMATGYTGSDGTIVSSPDEVADIYIAAATGTWIKGAQSAGPGSPSSLYIGGAATVIYELIRTDVSPNQTVNLPIYEVYIDLSKRYIRVFDGEIQNNIKSTNYNGAGTPSTAVVGLLLSEGPFYSLESVPDAYIDTEQVVTCTYSSDIVAKLKIGDQVISHENYAFGPLVVGAYDVVTAKTNDLSSEIQLTTFQRDPSMGLGPMFKTIYTWTIPFNAYQATSGIFNATVSLTFQLPDPILAEEISIDSIDTENLSALIFKDVVGYTNNTTITPINNPSTQYNTTADISIGNGGVDREATSHRIAFNLDNSSTFLVSPGGYTTFYDFGIFSGQKSLIKRLFPLRANTLIMGGESPALTASYSAIYDRAGIGFYKSSAFASWRREETRAALFRDFNMDPTTIYIYRDGVFETDPFPEETISEPLRAHYV